MDGVSLSWALDVLKPSFSVPGSSVSDFVAKEPNLTDPKDPGKDPRFRKLVEAILFSRRFLLTYNIVLVAILSVFTIWHWSHKLVLAKRRRRRVHEGKRAEAPAEEILDEAWSSSSSTVSGNITPPNTLPKDPDETSPLLPTRTRTPRKRGLWTPYHLFKSWLQYQPSPMLVVNKTLPTNAVTLLVLAFFALNVFYNFYRMPMELMYVFVFADRCGMLFVANLPLLYFLAAKNQPITFLTGYSYESLNIFHRRVGELLCFEAFLHFSGMMFVWYGLLRRLGFTLADFLLNRLVVLGLGAFMAYEILYFTSLGSFRQRCYEIFLATHVFLQIAGLVLLFFHHPTSRLFVGIALVIFVVDRLVYRLWLKTSSHPATLSILEDDETVLLSSNWDIEEHRNTFSTSNMAKGWKNNDHVFVTVPSLSKKHAIQAHPFTIFSAAPTLTPGDGKHAWFSLLIRAQHESGFTRTLLEYARSHPTTRIRLDGPYGSSHALDVLEDSDNAVIVAGGSGIAVAYPLLWALLHPTSDTEAGAVRTKRTVKLLWIIHSESHKSWVPEDKMKELQDWGLQVLIPAPTSEVGRPDAGKILRGWAEGKSTGIVVSGPDGLVRDVRNTSAALMGRGEDVRIQVEKFGW
jgi:hypothetical protein